MHEVAHHPRRSVGKARHISGSDQGPMPTPADGSRSMGSMGADKDGDAVLAASDRPVDWRLRPSRREQGLQENGGRLTPYTIPRPRYTAGSRT